MDSVDIWPSDASGTEQEPVLAAGSCWAYVREALCVYVYMRVPYSYVRACGVIVCIAPAERNNEYGQR